MHANTFSRRNWCSSAPRPKTAMSSRFTRQFISTSCISIRASRLFYNSFPHHFCYFSISLPFQAVGRSGLHRVGQFLACMFGKTALYWLLDRSHSLSRCVSNRLVWPSIRLSLLQVARPMVPSPPRFLTTKTEWWLTLLAPCRPFHFLSVTPHFVFALWLRFPKDSNWQLDVCQSWF